VTSPGGQPATSSATTMASARPLRCGVCWRARWPQRPARWLYPAAPRLQQGADGLERADFAEADRSGWPSMAWVGDFAPGADPGGCLDAVRGAAPAALRFVARMRLRLQEAVAALDWARELREAVAGGLLI